MNHETVLNRVRATRKDKGISIQEMADRLSMDKRNYERFEHNDHKRLDLDLLQSVSEILEKDLGYFLAPESIYFAPVQHNSPANVTGIYNDNITVHPSPETEALHHIILEQRKVMDDQRLIIQEQRAVIDAVSFNK